MQALGYDMKVMPDGVKVEIGHFALLEHLPYTTSDTAQVLLFEEGQPAMAAAQSAIVPKLHAILEALK